MVMHRALFTWFILLIFLILLSLRLETRIMWNWFLILVPLWIFDVILLIYALFNLFSFCKHYNLRAIIKNENINLILTVLTVLLKMAAQIILCLKLEYEFLQLQLVHVLIPVWLLLSVLILDVSLTLYRNGNNLRSNSRSS